jgi:hypothetical protein
MAICRLQVMPIGAVAFLGCANTPPPLRQLAPPPPVEIPNGTPANVDPVHPVLIRYQYYPETQSGPDPSAQSVGRVARLSGNVRQPNHVLAY